MIARFSTYWARMELACAALLAAGITVLILLNVVTRSLGYALFWVDELAIYLMIWMAFLTASAAVHHRTSVSVTILADALPERVRVFVAKAVDVLLFFVALLMLWFCWRWFGPADFIRAGLDVEAFQGETFNFIYSEITNTLPFRKVWVWLCIWVFAFGLTLHSLGHLVGSADTPDQNAERRS